MVDRALLYSIVCAIRASAPLHCTMNVRKLRKMKIGWRVAEHALECPVSLAG